MHTCSLLTIRLSLLCAAMIIIHIACVTLLLLQTRDGQENKLTISLAFSLSTIQLVTVNDKACIAAILNWTIKEGQDYV